GEYFLVRVLFFLQEIEQGVTEGAVVFDEALIVVGFGEEVTQLLSCTWSGPVLDQGGVARDGLNALIGYSMSCVIHLVLEQSTVGGGKFYSCFSVGSESFPQDRHVFLEA